MTMRIAVPLIALLPAASAFVAQQSHNVGARTMSLPPLEGVFSKIFRGGKVPVAEKDTAVFPKITENFPAALTNPELMSFLTSTLRSNGYNEGKTLIATSLCCDEVNRPLETELGDIFDTTFNMGGLAGFPFGGATSFGAMAAHIPDGGSCAVVYGPHVGVDSKGEIGTVERRGRKYGGACCGSAVAASGYVAGVYDGDEPEATLPTSALDAQQYFVGSMLMPYAKRLDDAENKMLELPYALYDAQTKLMKRIVKESASAVGIDGTIAVLGGVQINTPPGYTDYFEPLSFDLYNSKGELIKQLFQPKLKKFPKASDVFPGAIPQTQLIELLTTKLREKGFKESRTLCATSLCCDEVNRPLESDLADVFDTNFNMGGLAGFAFGGATSFGAMASHIPDKGDCVVVYGPHVGVDSIGNAGTVERRGRAKGGACCGSAVAASGYVAEVFSGRQQEAKIPDDPLDAQQFFVGSMLMPYAERLDKARDTMVELPYALYDAQTDLMKNIVQQSASAVAGKGRIAVLGGIQVNTPPGYEDYFLPISMDLYNNKGELVEKVPLK